MISTVYSTPNMQDFVSHLLPCCFGCSVVTNSMAPGCLEQFSNNASAGPSCRTTTSLLLHLPYILISTLETEPFGKVVQQIPPWLSKEPVTALCELGAAPLSVSSFLLVIFHFARPSFPCPCAWQPHLVTGQVRTG